MKTISQTWVALLLVVTTVMGGCVQSNTESRQSQTSIAKNSQSQEKEKKVWQFKLVPAYFVQLKNGNSKTGSIRKFDAENLQIKIDSDFASIEDIEKIVAKKENIPDYSPPILRGEKILFIKPLNEFTLIDEHDEDDPNIIEQIRPEIAKVNSEAVEEWTPQNNQNNIGVRSNSRYVIQEIWFKKDDSEALEMRLKVFPEPE